MKINSKKITNFIFILIGLSLLGIFDTTYLTTQFFTGGDVICGIVEGCDLVLSSIYSKILGMPISSIGLAYYIILLSLLLIFYSQKNKLSITFTTALSGVGVLFSIYLIYLQLIVIKAICLYCMASATISIVIFILSFYIYKSIQN